MRRVHIVTAMVFVLLALVAVACTVATPTPATGGDEVTIHEAAYTATEYAFSGPDTLTAGWNRISLTNEGPAELHHAQFIKLPEGMTQEQVMAALQSPVPPEGLSYGGGPSVFVPGEGGAVIVNLEPGSYLVVCFLPDAQGVPHAAHGMLKFVTVEGEAVTAMPDIESDVTIQLVDFSFVAPELTAGKHIIRVENIGEEPHELFMAQLVPDATMEQMIHWTESPEGPPPGKPVGGIQAIDPGDVAFFEVEVAPGNYGLACFVPSAANEGQPHFMLGMVADITVE